MKHREMLPALHKFERSTCQPLFAQFLTSDTKAESGGLCEEASELDPQELANTQNTFFQDLGPDPFVASAPFGASFDSWAQAAAAAAHCGLPLLTSDGFVHPLYDFAGSMLLPGAGEASLYAAGSGCVDVTFAGYGSPESWRKKHETCDGGRSMAARASISGGGKAHVKGTQAKPKPSVAKGQPMPHNKVPKRSNLKEQFEHYSTSACAVTTLMIRNVPNACDRPTFMAELDGLNFRGQYNFLYLPFDSKSKMNVGFAFVNFDSPEIAQRCIDTMTGYQFTRVRNSFNARRLVHVSVAHLQGLEANLAHCFKTHVFLLPIERHQPWVREKDARLMRHSLPAAKRRSRVRPMPKEELLASDSPEPDGGTSPQLEEQPEDCGQPSSTAQAELGSERELLAMNSINILSENTDINDCVDYLELTRLESSDYPARNRRLPEGDIDPYMLFCEELPMAGETLSLTSQEQTGLEEELESYQKSALDVLGQFLEGSGQDVLKDGPVINDEAGWVDREAHSRLAANVAYPISPLWPAFLSSSDVQSMMPISQFPTSAQYV
eukprot:TRINITY_DN18065_c0_g1_i1.p1 TRINITY_DN18065_c0_g1~~TRINITY_DN18065_c0_g1_i1.p1  ORF type:complete len:560 (+),score=89.13 TRINITY_DN18065_c0_g1_i1:26-1681(+)